MTGDAGDSLQDVAGTDGGGADGNGHDGDDGQERDGRYFVRAVDRGMAILRCFAEDHSRLTLSAVAAKTGVSRAVARRFLLTFQDLGYVTQEDGRFFLTPKILELSVGYLSGLPIRDVAVPQMEELSAGIDESCSLAVLDGDDIVHIARIATRRLIRSVVIVGSRFPAHASSLGRVLLAYLDAEERERYLARAELRPLTEFTITDPDELRRALQETRQRGWALTQQELDFGLLSIAVPVLDERGTPIAALNVSTSLSRHPPEYLTEEILPRLQATAGAISRGLSLAGRGARVVVNV